MPSETVGSVIASRSPTGLYSSSYDQYDVVQSSYERKKCSSGGGVVSEHLKLDEITADVRCPVMRTMLSGAMLLPRANRATFVTMLCHRAPFSLVSSFGF